MSLIGKKRGRPISRIQFDSILKKFLVFLKKELRINYDIPIILVDDADFSKKVLAFAEISKDNMIYLSIINRHPMDILRTLAYEYVHYKQNNENKIHRSGPGSPSENQANAKAGEIVRKYGQLHPELFDLMPIR
jgi:hypothetical protein